MVNNDNTEFIENQIDQKSKILNWERLRDIYKPEKINLLLIGEAPPDPNSDHNFYEVSPLTEYTREAFQQSFSKIKSRFTFEEFLHYFRLLGCFFEYLGNAPVNKKDALKRNHFLIKNLPDFIRRLKESPPKIAIVLVRRIDFLVKYAFEEAGLSSVKINYMSFPSSYRGYNEIYINKLRQILSSEKELGTFPFIKDEKRVSHRQTSNQSDSVELKIPGIPAYQLKIKDLSPNGTCVLIDQNSKILRYLDINQELDMKYYTNNGKTQMKFLKAQIKHMTKAYIPPFQRYFFVGLKISDYILRK
jgi:hypothetical protein